MLTLIACRSVTPATSHDGSALTHCPDVVVIRAPHAAKPGGRRRWDRTPLLPVPMKNHALLPDGPDALGIIAPQPVEAAPTWGHWMLEVRPRTALEAEDHGLVTGCSEAVSNRPRAIPSSAQTEWSLSTAGVGTAVHVCPSKCIAATPVGACPTAQMSLRPRPEKSSMAPVAGLATGVHEVPSKRSSAPASPPAQTFRADVPHTPPFPAFRTVVQLLPS